MYEPASQDRWKWGQALFFKKQVLTSSTCDSRFKIKYFLTQSHPIRWLCYNLHIMINIITWTIIIILLCLGIYVITKLIAGIRRFMKNHLQYDVYANKHGYIFTPQPENPLPNLEGAFFNKNLGITNKSNNLLSGTYNGKPFRYFFYYTSRRTAITPMSLWGEGSKQLRSINKDIFVLEMEHQKNWPSAFIYRHVFDIDVSTGFGIPFTKIPIDQNFDDYFDTYTSSDSEQKVKDFLDARKLDTLLQVSGRAKGVWAINKQSIVGFELTQHKLYIFYKYFLEEKDLDQAFANADTIISSLYQ